MTKPGQPTGRRSQPAGRQSQPAGRQSQRECPSCALAVPTDAAACPYCGYEFPVRKAGTRASAWLFVALMALFAVPLLAWLLGLFG